MKIIVETLNHVRDNVYKVDHSKDEIIATTKTVKNINTAIDKKDLKKSTLTLNQLTRVHICYNDDKITKRCEIIE